MIIGMTGFGSREAEIGRFGKFRVELRTANHKFLDIVLHLPEGFLSLEDKIKKEIEGKIKRGRVTCVVSVLKKAAPQIFVNKALLKNYISEFKKIQHEFGIKDGLSMDILIHLPGVLSLIDSKVSTAGLWPHLNTILNAALDELLIMRRKEGKALFGHLRGRVDDLGASITFIEDRFKKVIKEKAEQLKTGDERAAFLKDSDITEELERLSFHTRTMKAKLQKAEPVGKELDFVAQEMQREANTMGAKTFDVQIAGRVVHVKSQIEKIREQLQNIE